MRPARYALRPAATASTRTSTAVRNLERAGVPRSAAMKMLGHKTEAIYRRYAIADENMLREGAAKLAFRDRADPLADFFCGKRSAAIADPERVAGDRGR